MATLALLLLTTSIVGVTTVAAPVDSAPVDCSRGVNLGFETPLVRDAPMGPAPNWALHDESNVPGWDTSASDNRLEFWESTFLGVPSYTGGQHAEMNATQPSILHQDIATLGGDVIEWTVAHRARTGPTDSADVRFGATGSPVLQAVMTSGTGSWSVYTGTYVVPAGQTTTRMSFVSNDPGSLGNFLDGIELELAAIDKVTDRFEGVSPWIDRETDIEAAAVAAGAELGGLRDCLVVGADAPVAIGLTSPLPVGL